MKEPIGMGLVYEVELQRYICDAADIDVPFLHWNALIVRPHVRIFATYLIQLDGRPLSQEYYTL